MRPVLISGPEIVVTAAEARATGVFTPGDADAYVNLLLRIAQEDLEGSDGRLGRAIGLQTLQIEVPASCTIDTSRLPLPPYIETVSDVVNGVTRTFQWKAGYGANPAMPIPAAIKHAIIMMAGVLRDAVPADEGVLKSKTVDGVGRWDYSLPDGAAASMQKAADALLSRYWVPRV